MSTLHARLLAELDAERTLDYCHECAQARQAQAALRAVVELHAPVKLRIYSAGVPVEVAVCDHCASLCHSRSGLGCDEPRDGAYPCEDIRTIAEQLGVTTEGDDRG